jgi:alkylation response protein AidB-like acyl-CoA dehydrogenase
VHADLRKKLRKRSVELGFYGIAMPEEVGGGGISTVDRMLLHEEAAKHDTVFDSEIFGSAGGPTPILLSGSDKQKEKYLAPLMKGEITTCFGLSEPGAGSDATNISTSAVKKGDKWILNGRALHLNALADCHGVRQHRQGRARRITCFLGIGRAGADFDHPQHTMDGNGWVGELVFEDCEVSDDNVLGRVGFGFSLAMHWINDGRLNIGAASVGIAKRMLKLSLDYAKQRVTFGQPIANYQLIQAMLADMATEIFAAENMVYRSAWMKDQGIDIRKEAAMVKVYGAEMVNRAVDTAMQIHGGMGFMRETPIEHVMRWARVPDLRGHEESSASIAKSLLKSRWRAAPPGLEARPAEPTRANDGAVGDGPLALRRQIPGQHVAPIGA